MTHALSCMIEFPESGIDGKGIVIRKPESIRIEKSWKQLTDRATIVMARNVKYFDKFKIKEVFKTGQPLTISLAANGDMVEEFTGYISKVSAGYPITIECEDEMYQLKKVPVHVAIEQCTLKELFTSILPGYLVDCLDVNIGSQRHPNTTVAQVLKTLQDNFGFYSYMKSGTLVCGKIYEDDAELEPVKLHLEKNVVNQNLNFKSKEDVKIKIKGISTLPGGGKLQYEFGESDGELRQLSYYNIDVLAELEKIVKKDYERFKADGLTGDVTTYAKPIINHGQKVEIESEWYPERNGVYYVDTVKTEYSDGGYHRILTLGDKV